MEIGNIIKGHVNEFLGLNEDISENPDFPYGLRSSHLQPAGH